VEEAIMDYWKIYLVSPLDFYEWKQRISFCLI